jgi:hypothetical protein
MNRLEILALSIAKATGGFDSPESEAFKLRNPGLLRTYRPEKKTDSEHRRVFSSFMGGFKALTADLQAKCSGKNRKITPENSLSELLALLGFPNSQAVHKIVVFINRSLGNETVAGSTPISFFNEVGANLNG